MIKVKEEPYNKSVQVKKMNPIACPDRVSLHFFIFLKKSNKVIIKF